MSKIHPTVSRPEVSASKVSERTMVWTVWKKSSMAFVGTDGFSVYDSKGRLAFRVDNYSRLHKYLCGELILMDGVGRALLALRPQILSMHDRWNGFKVNEDNKNGFNSNNMKGFNSNVFSMKRRLIFQEGDDVEVFMGQCSTPSFVIHGFFRKRSCKILDKSGKVVAEISRKKASNSVELGDDVFSLILQPGVDCQLMMALLIVMDRICQKSYSPLMC